jgi:class 3 adenylate cyclase
MKATGHVVNRFRYETHRRRSDAIALDGVEGERALRDRARQSTLIEKKFQPVNLPMRLGSRCCAAESGRQPDGSPMQRTLAAILMADVAGYTRLMDEYEADTHQRLMALLDEVVEPAIATATGRIVKNTGDGFLAYFPSVSSAVECAAQGRRSDLSDRSPSGTGPQSRTTIGHFQRAMRLASEGRLRDYGGAARLRERLHHSNYPGLPVEAMRVTAAR